MKYIDADKLKSIIKTQIKERKEWMKDIDRSDRQDQLWSDLNGEDMSILQIINSLQQEQPSILYNLDEIAEEWAQNEAYGKSDAEFEMAYKGFKAGAEWMAKQMV